MDVKIELWSVKELYDIREEINQQPRYQRGGVWVDQKKSLLIDSMLRGIDMPKIYLHKKNKGAHSYEVADGQQRITSLFKFRSGKLALREDSILGLDLNKIGRYKIGGKFFNELHQDLQNIFDKYQLTIAIVEQATNDEIRTLFGRLQLGEILKPAEKRNAILCKVGNDIDTLATTHKFFVSSKIPKERFNQQDFLAHALTLISYNNSFDLKADLIQRMYLDKSLDWSFEELQKIDIVLDTMFEIDSRSKKRINKKFWFLDIFWFLYQNLKPSSIIDYIGFANKFDMFEQERKSNHKEPGKLLEQRIKDKDLYEYVMSFRFEGNRAINYTKRNRVVTAIFSKFISNEL